jgi:hypothetical protein
MVKLKHVLQHQVISDHWQNGEWWIMVSARVFNLSCSIGILSTKKDGPGQLDGCICSRPSGPVFNELIIG